MSLDTWHCAVPAAFLWTSPQSPQAGDEPGLRNPIHMPNWLQQLDTQHRLSWCEENRIQSQLLYGEPVIVEETQGEWAKVKAVWQSSSKDRRGYPGWIPLAQIKKGVPIQAEGFARILVHKAQLWNEQGELAFILSFNTILPYERIEEGILYVCTPDGQGRMREADVETAPSIHQFQTKQAEFAVELGMSFLELPYVWGGMSAYGYDCSGFVYNMLKACGMLIARDAKDQAKEGQPVQVDNPSMWKKGDLLFFSSDMESAHISHVALYYGEGLILHAPSTGSSIELAETAIMCRERKLCGVRRLGLG